MLQIAGDVPGSCCGDSPLAQSTSPSYTVIYRYDGQSPRLREIAGAALLIFITSMELDSVDSISVRKVMYTCMIWQLYGEEDIQRSTARNKVLAVRNADCSSLHVTLPRPDRKLMTGRWAIRDYAPGTVISRRHLIAFAKRLGLRSHSKSTMQMRLCYCNQL